MHFTIDIIFFLKCRKYIGNKLYVNMAVIHQLSYQKENLIMFTHLS